MLAPLATARLQLHAGYTLDDAAHQVPYYARLGISHYYLSPIATARPGSTHGYDVTDHSCVNPELGGEAALVRLVACLRAHGMGVVLDIVPNHMAIHPANRWWWDVLAQGRRSAYASWLDIAWDSPEAGLYDKVLAPFLALPYGDMLHNGRIALQRNPDSGAYCIAADGMVYPVAAGSMQFTHNSIAAVLQHYDGTTSMGQQNLHQLLQRQHYKLAWWRCAADIINWRRFFEIGDLIGVRVEDPAVFHAVHQLSLRLYRDGLIDGLRIDHVDGLAQPQDYCRQLHRAMQQCHPQRPQALSTTKPWLIIEKILAPDEVLDARWQVDGTTGYDFMAQSGAVLHNPAGVAALSSHWAQMAPNGQTAADVLHQARQLMLDRHFVAERAALLRSLNWLAQANLTTRDLTSAVLGRALNALLVAFPVYRTYVDLHGRQGTGCEFFSRARIQAEHAMASQNDQAGCCALAVLDTWLGGADPEGLNNNTDPHYSVSRALAIQRFQQLTPPLAAKAQEDTAFYRYGRLLSRNEVGSDPDVFSMSASAFHACNQWRAERMPLSMLASATHDHKRGEDMRARLAVLSDVAQDWVKFSQEWLNQLAAAEPPANNLQTQERYMLMQTVVGAWPLDLTLDDEPGLRRFAQRVVQWQTKALREAKQHSSWLEPNLAYEQASAEFVMRLLCSGYGKTRIQMAGFAQRLAPAGVLNSLAQTVLKLTVPGVPDLYQGTELWDFSLVDPDNRQPVDFVLRTKASHGLGVITNDLLATWRTGQIKLALIAACLALRRQMPAVFMRGAYCPLQVQGNKQANVLAYMRVSGQQAIIVVVPRWAAAGLSCTQGVCLPAIDPGYWGDTCIVLPTDYPRQNLHNVLTGDQHIVQDGMLSLASLLARLPVAVLR